MSTREELAELLQDNITDALPIHPWRGEIREQVELAVQHVLAAGYTKQRTVTTVEELDALPGHVLILTEQGGYWESIKRFDRCNWWKEPGAHGGGYVAESQDLALPATVLYEPQP